MPPQTFHDIPHDNHFDILSFMSHDKLLGNRFVSKKFNDTIEYIFKSRSQRLEPISFIATDARKNTWNTKAVQLHTYKKKRHGVVKTHKFRRCNKPPMTINNVRFPPNNIIEYDPHMIHFTYNGASCGGDKNTYLKRLIRKATYTAKHINMKHLHLRFDRWYSDWHIKKNMIQRYKPESCSTKGWPRPSHCDFKDHKFDSLSIHVRYYLGPISMHVFMEDSIENLDIPITVYIHDVVFMDINEFNESFPMSHVKTVVTYDKTKKRVS
jgi:hypothetical protein